MANLDFNNCAVAIKEAFYNAGREEAQDVIQYFIEYMITYLVMEDNELLDMLNLLNKLCDKKLTGRDIEKIEDLLGEINQLANSSRYR